MSPARWLEGESTKVTTNAMSPTLEGKSTKVTTNAMSPARWLEGESTKVTTNAMSARAKSRGPRERSELACGSTTRPSAASGGKEIRDGRN
jgi:hypothetical protein